MSNNFNLYIKNTSLTEVEKVKKRQQFIKDSQSSGIEEKNSSFKQLFDINFPIERAGSNNCENMIGSIELPVGLVGPVEIPSFIENSSDNLSAKKIKNLFIPLATTEGALIASINRGCKALNLSKDLSVVIKKVGMARSMVFKCENTLKAHEFVNWMNKNQASFIGNCETTSNHLKFLSKQSFIRGRHVYLRFSFDTDEAMGMNMITIALQHGWEVIKSKHPGVALVSLSGNVCTDKKDSVLNRMFGRGFNVELDVVIPKKILSEVFAVKASDVVKSHVAKNLVGGNIAGSMAQNMHVANALSAFYIATGQDPAHVVGGSEASVTFEENGEDLYAALTLPTVSVGSVGGGTWLPQQTQARKLILLGQNKKVDVKILALATGVAALAGEISGLCALTNQSLAKAHEKLARGSHA